MNDEFHEDASQTLVSGSLDVRHLFMHAESQTQCCRRLQYRLIVLIEI